MLLLSEKYCYSYFLSFCKRKNLIILQTTYLPEIVAYFRENNEIMFVK